MKEGNNQMIKILKTTDNGFISIDDIEKDCWVNVSNPGPDELLKLSEDLSIPLDFLTDSLDVDERSRIETENNTTLIVLRVPKFDKDNLGVPFTTLPLGIVLTKDITITICLWDINEVLDLFKGKIRNLPTENRRRFILHLFHRTAFFYLKYLKEINKKSNEVEMELHRSMKNEELIKLLDIEKSLVFFTTSLRSNELMMERLSKIRALELNEDDKDLLDDIIVDNKQAIEMANIYSNILSGMMDAFASVISNNLTIVMKFLTSVTIILMLPTLVASIYGMNVELPFQHTSHAFFITIG
ncbi:MAG: magnesium transporter CorA family protein, partial [Desulfobacteraceae bacterium]|nr:magnesium transporter CorA family protein [Desulfobacteraceae bacterium]